MLDLNCTRVMIKYAVPLSVCLCVWAGVVVCHDELSSVFIFHPLSLSLVWRAVKSPGLTFHRRAVKHWPGTAE